MRGKCLMVQGTASSVGKSVLCAALLRIFRQDGLRCAPFKAQNMALNSYVTRDGHEIGRAQAMQAMAAGLEPDVRMNPVLLKPTGERQSQVIVMGKSVGTMSAMEYHLMKPKLRQQIREVYSALEQEMDCVVLEGAGSPAEINLREGDIVNMSMAEAADAPVLLVGDINPGGVFAALLGTLMLLEEQERRRVKGVIINKFRGDPAILEPGLRMLEERIHCPVLGVVPWMDVHLEEEDSLSTRFSERMGTGRLDIAVVRLPHISNFTDFEALALHPAFSVRYISSPEEIRGADAVILPGTKSTSEDLCAIRESGMAEAVVRYANGGGTVIGICGGYQMLGRVIRDPLGVESEKREVPGLALLDIETEFSPEKLTRQVRARGEDVPGWKLGGHVFSGYEIHAGRTRAGKDARVCLASGTDAVGASSPDGKVLGAYLHGLFDDGFLAQVLALRLSGNGNWETRDYDRFREQELDRAARTVRESLDMEAIYRILRGQA